ncbi:ABC transporter substrate-binding protein [Clostridium sp. BL-8]|uniref:ABC transporter substrate-binding protein n=1 Tax=Clostridium sp. BL-8 TaxID=349938 RepID=UPI00098C210D|nr:ABC transporter substrate-binding protein [Clostridium sp. BL-8]OOM78087.1 putative thiamine biosynthesis protein [Clostridium sp. BL-8]
MNKRILAFVMSCLMIFAMVGCNKATNQSEGSKGKDLEEVNVVLDWYPNAVHGFIYEAIEKGYYEQEGLKVNIEFPSNTNDAISLTAAGKADLGIYYLQDVAMARGNEDIPVKSVGAIVQSPLSRVISLKDKNIKSPKDLVGKKVGYGGTELSESIISTMLENVGEKKDSAQTVDVGFDIMSSMTTGNVDATIGGFINHEVPALEEQGYDLNYFSPTDYGVPNYYELVFVAGEDNLNKNSDKIARFLRASKKGFEDMKANPDEALNILMKNQNAENFPLSENVEKKSFSTLIPVMETKDAEFLSQDPKVWQDNIDWLAKKGLLKKSFDASEIVENLKY